MSEPQGADESYSADSDNLVNDPKVNFRKALEKKKNRNVTQFGGSKNSPTVSGGQARGTVPKMFRRKSGNA